MDPYRRVRTQERGQPVQEQQRSGTAWLAAMLAVAVLVPIVVGGVVLVGVGTSDSRYERSASSSTTAPTVVATTAPPTDDGLSRLAASGDLSSMVEKHRVMLEQMRASVSPQMQALMDSDPMAAMLRSGAFVRLVEDYEADIDQMLARGG